MSTTVEARLEANIMQRPQSGVRFQWPRGRHLDVVGTVLLINRAQTGAAYHNNLHVANGEILLDVRVYQVYN